MVKKISVIIIAAAFELSTFRAGWSKLEFPATSLRVLSFGESARQGSATREWLRKMGVPIPCTAAQLWGRLRYAPDPQFHEGIEVLRNNVSRTLFDVLRDMGYEERFKARYESGCIAGSQAVCQDYEAHKNEERFKARYDGNCIAVGSSVPEEEANGEKDAKKYKYNPHFGVCRDIRGNIAVIAKILHFDKRQIVEFLEVLQEKGPALSEITTFERFKKILLSHLKSYTAPSVDEATWKRLRAECGTIKPWISLYSRFKKYEESFVRRFQDRLGELTFDTDAFAQLIKQPHLENKSNFRRFLAAKDRGKLIEEGKFRLGFENPDEARKFLTELFWILLFDCKLTRANFESDDEYKDFLSSLFVEKFNRGEINEAYFGGRRSQTLAVRQAIGRELQRRLDEEYGVTEGHVLPLHLLEMYGEEQPNFHWFTDRDLYFTQLMCPLFHTLTALRGFPTHLFANGKDMRLALALHDIGKSTLMDWREHSEESARLVHAALLDWGLVSESRPYLTLEEEVYVEFLVRSHADFYLIQTGGEKSGPYYIADRLRHPAVLNKYMDEIARSWAIRRIAIGDTSAIPWISHQRIEEGAYSREAVQRSIAENLVYRRVQAAHTTLFTYYLERDFRESQPWMSSLSPWLKSLDINKRRTFFHDLAACLVDIRIDFSNPDEVGRGYQENMMNRYWSDISEFGARTPELAISEADALVFFTQAWVTYRECREDVLPSRMEEKGIIAQTPSPFERDLRTIVAEYDYSSNPAYAPALEFMNKLGGSIADIIEEKCPAAFGGDAVKAMAVGSIPRNTFVIRLTGTGKTDFVSDVDFDFVVYPIAPPSAGLDIEALRDSIPRQIINQLQGLDEFGIFAKKCRGVKVRDYAHDFYVLPDLPDTVLIRVKDKSGTRLVDITVTYHLLLLPSVVYNSAFEGSLKNLNPDERNWRIANMRLLRDFMRRLLKIPQEGDIIKADITEQLIAQNGGTFEGALGWIYRKCFDEKSKMRSFQEAKKGLTEHLADISGRGRVLLEDLTPEQFWPLARAARLFINFRERGISWTMRKVLGQPEIPMFPHRTVHLRDVGTGVRAEVSAAEAI